MWLLGVHAHAMQCALANTCCALLCMRHTPNSMFERFMQGSDEPHMQSSKEYMLHGCCDTQRLLSSQRAALLMLPYRPYQWKRRIAHCISAQGPWHLVAHCLLYTFDVLKEATSRTESPIKKQAE